MTKVIRPVENRAHTNESDFMLHTEAAVPEEVELIACNLL